MKRFGGLRCPLALGRWLLRIAFWDLNGDGVSSSVEELKYLLHQEGVSVQSDLPVEFLRSINSQSAGSF